MKHEEIEAYGYGNEIIFKNLEEKIMADIVRRIKVAGELSGSTTYLMEQLLYMGYSNEDIKRMIQEALEESEEYVDELYDKVLEDEYLGSSPIFQAKGVTMLPFKKNPVMQNLLSFAKNSTNGEMVNMTRTLGFVKNTRTGTKAVELSKFYKETMDKALMEVATGTFSLDRALNDAVNVMVNSGVRWIDYESGHHNRIAVAARRAVMTGLAHASQEQTKNMAKELDIHTFEVSAHMGARPSHAQWQGKVYTESELVSVCGLGEVTGLLGANCYHNYYMFLEGVSKRAYTDEQLEQWKDDTPTSYDGKEYTNYEARQRMRQMETNMRAQKEKIKLLKEGGASKEVIQSVQARYRKQMSEYEKFSDAMNLKTQKERITIGDGKTMKGVKAPLFHTYGDYLREKLGPVIENDYEEYLRIKDDIEKKGGKLILLDNNNMITNMFLGRPGEVKVDRNVSLGGLMHEYRHFLDDLERGCPGIAYYLSDNDLFFELEKRGYEEELAIARKYGYTDIEEKILQEIESRRVEVYGTQ